MRKNFRKIATVLAATTLFSVGMAGCGNSEATEKTDTTAKADTSAAGTEAESEKVEEAAEFSYPMDGAKVTVWGNNPASTIYENYSDSRYIQNVEAATGIEIEYTHPGDNSEAFNLMLADAEFTDIIEYGWNYYPGGLKGAYEDGIAIELNDVIDQYMPNFKAWIEENPDTAKKIRTDDGIYYAIPATTSDPAMGCVFGWYVRQDVMEDLGLEMPTTIDEWHDALVTMKEKLGIAPIAGVAESLNSGAFLNAYAPSINNSYYSIDAETGEVVYTPATDGYKKYLSTLAQWYEEGLIDKDIATNDNAAVKAKIMSGDAVIGFGYAGSALQTITMEAQEENPDFVLAAIPGCAAAEGEEILYCSADATYGAGGTGYAVITTACEDVEAAARYLDWLFSEEGILISNFGIEGETYTMVDGVPTYTDEIINNPDGKSIAEALQTYVRSMSMFPGVQTLEYLQGYYQLENAKAAPTTWGAYGSTEYEVTGLSYTTEESEALSTIAANIGTEMSESRIKFVIGTLDIDTEWDAYVERLNSLGLEEAVEISQAAYERYLER